MFNYGKDDDVIVRCIHFDSTPPTLIKIPPLHSTDYDVKTLLRSFPVTELPMGKRKGEKEKKKRKKTISLARCTHVHAREIKNHGRSSKREISQ